MGLGKLLGKLLGGGGSSTETSEPADAIEYNGYTITATPLKDGAQFKTAGFISKQIEGELKKAQFIRADNHADRASAVSHAERKAQQIIDEQGDAIFKREHI